MEIASSLTLSLSSSIPKFAVHLPSSSFLVSTSTSAFLDNTRISINNPPLRARTRSRTTQSNKGFTCNALFGLGVPELVVIAGVAALVFGPKKLPEVGRSIGKTVKSFQQVSLQPSTYLYLELVCFRFIELNGCSYAGILCSIAMLRVKDMGFFPSCYFSSHFNRKCVQDGGKLTCRRYCIARTHAWIFESLSFFWEGILNVCQIRHCPHQNRTLIETFRKLMYWGKLRRKFYFPKINWTVFVQAKLYFLRLSKIIFQFQQMRVCHLDYLPLTWTFND